MDTASFLGPEPQSKKFCPKWQECIWEGVQRDGGLSIRMGTGNPADRLKGPTGETGPAGRPLLSQGTRNVLAHTDWFSVSRDFSPQGERHA